jgi:hypothetical protein
MICRFSSTMDITHVPLLQIQHLDSVHYPTCIAALLGVEAAPRYRWGINRWGCHSAGIAVAIADFGG